MSWRTGERVVGSMPVGFLALDQDWRISAVNPAGEAMIRASAADLVGRVWWDVFPAAVQDNVFAQMVRTAADAGRTVTLEAFYPAPLERWFEASAVPDENGVLLFFTDVTERRVARERLAMLARVSAELAGTLDPVASVARLPRLLVPTLGTFAILTVVEDDGRLTDLGSWHPRERERELVRRYSGSRLAAMPPTAPLLRALTSGEAVLTTGSEVLDLLPDGEARDVLAELAPRSGVLIPLRGRGRLLGVLTLWSEVSARYDGAELDTALEVADRIGLALDNGRLYRQQAQLAEELQRSLLTEPLQPDHTEVVVRYTPAAEAARVGGDWYDAFLQPGGSVMLVIGDVVGHDTAAAAAMGQLRGLLRGVATYSDAGPSEVLRGLDAAMTLLDLKTLATAAVARLEQTPEEVERGVTRMRWANAGHLAPLVVHADGTLAELPSWRGDLLLGMDTPVLRREFEVVMERGSTVLLFTDGLIERRDGDLDEGMQRLREAVGELAGAPLDELCDELVERLVHGHPEDDVALVAVRLHPQDRPRPASAGPTRVPPGLPPDPARPV